MSDSLLQQSFSAIILDLDQTLVDSAGALTSIWQQWMTHYRITPEPGRNWGGWTSEAIIRLCLPTEQMAEGIARMEALEVSTTGGITALPGARETLRVLPPHRVAIGTSSTLAVARARIAAAGLPMPRTLVTACDVEHGKPAPDIFRVAAERLGVEPGSCLVVEDAPAGLQAARAAGMATLALLTSTPADELDADLVVDDLSRVGWQVVDDTIRLVPRA